MIQVDSAPRRPWMPFLTLLAALILLVLPMQALPGGFVPDWVSLVLIYWALAFPVRMGVPIAWVT
ncbi:MAG: rod shape-determining protein MreD, partial [Proteobacteria bacterium]|nr:rod shape-determining protein MreD [Pseudomonadota bacterium]